MLQKRWTIKNVDYASVMNLKRQLGGIREQLCTLFAGRGIDSYEKARDFFLPSLATMHDPWKMKGMPKATNRILSAISQGEKILLFGDYDVDGTAAVAMMYRFLMAHYSPENVSYYVPDRYKEGYGLSHAGIEYAIHKGVNLIITLDCGISNTDLINESGPAKIDYIICDHHLPGKELPAALAILNPKQNGCPYPFKELCGSGVAFKLITALCNKMGLPDECYLQYLDLAALATGADVVPVVDENRIFTYFGLKKINENPNEGIKALKNTDLPDSIYTLTKVIFGLAPKINAAGRMGHGKYAVELLIQDDKKRAAELAQLLNDYNRERKAEDTLVTKEALTILKDSETVIPGKSSVIYKEGWHKGVLGIVASRLIESYYRPTIVLTAGERFVSGSARSIQGFNIYEAISKCREYLVKFGGHYAAAGLTMYKENVAAFSEKFENVVSQSLPPELSISQITIDLEIDPDIIDYPFYNTLLRMEPFGQGNPEPVFLSRRVALHQDSRIVGEDHVRFVFKTNNNQFFVGIGFNLKDKFNELRKNKPVDIVYNINENEWNNQKSLQLKIIDFKESS